MRLLLDIDLRSRAGAAFDQKRLRGQLESHLDGLHRLEQEDWSRTPAIDRSLVVHRLLISASRFADSSERATFATESRELKEVGEAVRYVERLSYRLPDYLHCHGEMVVRWADNPDLADVATQLERLVEGLLRFQEELRAREGQRLVVSSADDSLVARARSLRETEDSIRNLWQTQIDFLAANADQPANRDRIVGLLLTRVWNATQRQRLVACLDRPLETGAAGTARHGAVAPALVRFHSSVGTGLTARSIAGPAFRAGWGVRGDGDRATTGGVRRRDAIVQ